MTAAAALQLSREAYMRGYSPATKATRNSTTTATERLGGLMTLSVVLHDGAGRKKSTRQRTSHLLTWTQYVHLYR